MYFIGIDLGTTGCKTILFDYEGRILSERYIEYGLIKCGENCIEQDANLWWSLVRQTVLECVAASGVDASGIKALSISSQGISFVPVDRSGNTLYNAISWLDTRAAEQTALIENSIDKYELFRRTGKRISPSYTLPKLMWVKKNMPALYEKTYKFLMGLDYIIFKLTGKIVTDYSMASGTMAFNIEERKWDDEILAKTGIDSDKLPEVRCAGSPVGRVLPDVAAEMGLHPGVMVVLGAQDQKCAAIGAGAGKGIVAVSIGTASAICSICSKPVFDRKMRVPCFALDKGSWILESYIGTSGISLKWLRATLFENLSYREMDSLAEESQPGAGGVFFYPHMQGASSPYWRNDIKGFIYGLTLLTSKADIIRALFEGIAFQIKVNMDTMQELSNETVKEIRIFGGGSSSELWCRIIADVTGVPVSVLYTPEIANLGAAVFAGLGSGVYGNYEEVVSKVQLVKRQYAPNKEAHRTYGGIFEKYLGIQEKLLS